MILNDTKKEIRRSVRAAMRAMDSDGKSAQATHLCSAALEHALLQDARVVALFAPLPDEPDISPLINTLYEKCTVVLPRISGDTMDFYPYSPHSMSSGSYGINEPQGNEPVAPSAIDVMLVPGVAFTREGFRLGRGKGFYDRYMSNEGFRAYKRGVCYLQQIVDVLPVEEHDIRMDEILYFGTDR